MKNKMFFAGILGMALVFAIMGGGCDNGTTTQTFTVSFFAGEGSGTPPADMTANDGSSITLPGKGNMTAPSGKEFDGWLGDGRNYAAGASYTVTKNVLFVAQWKASASKTYFNVSFTAGEGTGSAPASMTVEDGNSITLPGKGNMTAPAGKEFDGWQGDGRSLAEGASYTVTKDVTFVAQWKAGASAGNTFTVSFTAGEGSGTPPASVTVENGKSTTLPGKGNMTAPAGKEFDGWQGDGKTLAAGASYTVTKDVTFIAQWKANNPLVGMWYSGGTANDPHALVVFSNSNSDGRQFMYGLWRGSLQKERNINVSSELLEILGSQYVYSLNGNTLTVKNYFDDTGKKADVAFTRIEGSTRTDVYDVWYTARRTEDDLNRTILVIKTNNVMFTAAGYGWDRWEYEADTVRSRVDWKDDNTTTGYSLDGSTLTLNWGDPSVLSGPDHTKTTL